jgi:drug/metabolite transporter (DMT)-like permease
MTSTLRRLLCLASLAALAAEPAAAAVSVSGGIDPTTGLTTLGSWILSLVGVAIPIICAFKGTHAVAEGRHLAPYIGSAIGGMVLAFGGAYILTHYGVT